jgi:hypothetical protein
MHLLYAMLLPGSYTAFDALEAAHRLVGRFTQSLADAGSSGNVQGFMLDAGRTRGLTFQRK